MFHTNLILQPSSSGRSSLMNTASTPLAPTPAPPSSSLRGSTSTTTRPPEESTCPGPCWWTLSPAPWTALGADPLDRSSDPTTSCLDNLELETTGLRATTLRVSLVSVELTSLVAAMFILTSNSYRSNNQQLSVRSFQYNEYLCQAPSWWTPSWTW